MKSDKEKKAEYDKKRYQETREKQLEYSRDWHQRNKEKKKKYYQANKESRLSKAKLYRDTVGKYKQAAKTYNITFEEAKELYSRTHCEICKKEHKETPSIDHNHKTGKIRGALCRKCNAALGTFNDSVDMLNKAIEYLNKNN